MAKVLAYLKQFAKKLLLIHIHLNIQRSTTAKRTLCLSNNFWILSAAVKSVNLAVAVV